MFMRLVQMKVEAEHLPEFRKDYEDRVLPFLSKTPGCLYAALMSSNHQPGDFISLTLWDKQQSAEIYESTGTFSRLIEAANKFFSTSSEWRVYLTENLTMEYEPVREEPHVDSYQVALADREKKIPGENALFVRIVTPEIREGMEDEFQRIYQQEVLPALLRTPGCRSGYLTRHGTDRTKFLSISLWDSVEQAAAYERSGTFQRLVEKLEHTFSDIYQWKRQLQSERAAAAPKSKQLSVEGYDVVIGKTFV